MNPYSQLHMMQQAGVNQFIPGLGMMSPQAGGAAQLQAMAGAYGSSIPGETMVDTSPMAGLGYSGPSSGLVNFAGNMMLMPMMQNSGMMPMGNAGSYQQARRQNQFQNMQQQVTENVASGDADSIFRTMRGAAAMSGMPMNADQTEAARSFATTIANAGPSVEMFMPGVLDAVSGETGSIQSMASQVTSANRYRLDPSSGNLGFSADSNTKLVEGLFEDMFNADNLTSMQGLRAGDMGSLYKRLSSEGLAGPSGSIRDRTISAIQDIQGKGGSQGLTDIAQDMNVNLDDLGGLSNAQLSELRQSSTAVSDQLTESDTDRISSQLQGYVKSLSAIREVFGENGNPNAPIPELIGALEALTNNKMQQFDASRLNTMVRDMQSLSQSSGKSIDQLTAMRQNNIANINSMTGYGGEHFAGASTNYGVTTGQAFQQVGGATGFGALSRNEAEAGAQSLFNRSMDSTMANTLGTLGRIEETGGIQDNAAGRDLKAALAAVRSGGEFYTDANGTQRRTPRREHEFRSFMQKGAVEGMGVGDFNMMLGQEFANREQLAGDEDLKRGAVRQQFFAFEEKVNSRQGAAGTVLNSSALQGIAPGAAREAASRDLTAAATSAMFALTPEEFADENLRRQAMVDALQSESAGIAGLDLTDAQSRQLAGQIYGKSNDIAMERTGQGTLAIMQMQGRSVSNAQRSAEARATALAGRNEAMTAMGPKGTGMQRLFTAIQKQGDKGEKADLTTLMGDLFGAESLDSDDLSDNMQRVSDLNKRSEEISAQLDGAPPEERRRLEKEVAQVNEDLAEATANVQDEGRRLGIVNVEGEFNRSDVNRTREARREISSRTDRSAIRDYLKSSAKVTKKEIEEAADSDLTADDFTAMAKAAQEVDRELLSSLTDEMILGSSSAQYAQGDYGDKQQELAGAMREKVIASQESGRITEAAAIQRAREESADYNRDLDNYRDDPRQLKIVKDIKGEDIKERVLRNRKAEEADELLSVSREDVEERMELMDEDKLKPLGADATPVDKLQRQTELDSRMSDEDFDSAIDEMQTNGADENLIEERKRLRNQRKKVKFEQAQDQLIAENGLIATGVLDADETLRDADLDLDDADISDEARDMLMSGDTTQQREALTQIARDKRRGKLFSGDSDKSEINQQDVRGVADNLAQLDASADEYLRDSDAIMRGGQSGLDAANDYQEARKDLQSVANRYSVEKGELGAGELLAKGVDLGEVTDAANKEFEEMNASEKDAAFKKVNEAIAGSDELKERFGGRIDASDEDAFKEAYAAVRAGEEQQNLDDIRSRLDSAAEGMESGAETDYRNILQVSSEQTEAAKELYGKDAKVSAAQARAYDLLKGQGELGDDPDKNKERVNEVAADLEAMQGMSDSAAADLDKISMADRSAAASYEKSSLKSTMTKEEYMAAVRGETDISSLKMFDDDEQLTDANRDVEQKKSLELKIKNKERMIASSLGGKNVQAETQLKSLKGQLGKVQGRIDTARDGMSEEDYRMKLSQQSDVKKLESRSEKMSNLEGDSDLLDTRSLLTDEAADEASKLGEAGNATDTLLSAIGFSKDDDGRDLAKADGFGGSEENVRMVADELKKLETVSDDFGDTGLQKLESITEKYSAAGHSSSKKDALAKELDMGREDLDSMMDRTDFMDLDKEGDQFTGKSSDSEALSEMFKSVEDKDLETEIKEEEDRTMRLTGTLEVVGEVISGQATFNDVTGTSNATGAL